MTNKFTKKYSIFLVIMEMQIKNLMTIHFTPVLTMAIIKISKKRWQECGEKGTLIHYRQECKLVQPLFKKKIPKKLKTELLYDVTISFPGIYLKEVKSACKRDYLHARVYCGTIHNSQDMESAWC
jgi:hypothetical protein